MSQRRSVAVSFCYLDADPYPRQYDTGLFRDGARADRAGWGPILRVLTDPASDLRGRVSHWYYLCHPAAGGSRRVAARTAAEAAVDVSEAIKEHVPQGERPVLKVVTWETVRPPNDYADLYETTKRELRKIRLRHAGVEIVLVVTGGTPEMQGALLLAGSVGVIEAPIRLVQVERNEGARRRPERPVFDVNLEIPTVLKLAGTAKAPSLSGPSLAPTSGYDQACSPRLKETLRVARLAAPLPFPVLLRGERGSGKSRLATFIRLWSPFRNTTLGDSWPAVACGQFTDPQLMLAELCGSVKGGFTGALDRKGLFDVANGDTFFMDEIHDLSNAGQRTLMRVLEDGVYYAVGSRGPETTTFRLIAGTNLNDSELRDRLFPDFFDRIRDIEIEVPPLRECREDHPWMWRAAWTAAARKARVEAALDESAHDLVVALLGDETLPGNWRDLRRIAVRILIEIGHERLSHGQLRTLVKGTLREELEPKAVGHDTSRLSKKGLTYYQRLEETLGKDLERFWAEVAGSRGSPTMVLERLLRSPSRARRAADFIRASSPDRWRGLGVNMTSNSRQRRR